MTTPKPTPGALRWMNNYLHPERAHVRVIAVQGHDALVADAEVPQGDPVLVPWDVLDVLPDNSLPLVTLAAWSA
jgi:hypothetical protein